MGGERVERDAQSVLVGAHLALLVGPTLWAGVVDPAARFPDPLDEPGPYRVAAGDLDQGVLQRRGAGVDDEHVTAHDAGPSAGASGRCAWMAVIATVLTMSRTVAPRDRSFTGLRSPCRTGPTATAPADRCTERQAAVEHDRRDLREGRGHVREEHAEHDVGAVTRGDDQHSFAQPVQDVGKRHGADHEIGHLPAEQLLVATQQGAVARIPERADGRRVEHGSSGMA